MGCRDVCCRYDASRDDLVWECGVHVPDVSMYALYVFREIDAYTKYNFLFFGCRHCSGHQVPFVLHRRSSPSNLCNCKMRHGKVSHDFSTTLLVAYYLTFLLSCHLLLNVPYYRAQAAPPASASASILPYHHSNPCTPIYSSQQTHNPKSRSDPLFPTFDPLMQLTPPCMHVVYPNPVIVPGVLRRVLELVPG